MLAANTVNSCISAKIVAKSTFRYIRFGKFADAIQRSLQFRVIAFPFGVSRILRNIDFATDPQKRPRKWFGDHAFVPGIQHPGIFQRDMKRHHGSASRTRQHHRSRLGHVPRPAWPINRERNSRALFDLSPHPQQRAHSTLAARAPHFDKSKFANDSSRVLTIEAVAAHHADLQISPRIDRGKNAAVPERQDQRPGLETRRSAFFIRHRQLHRRSNQADNDHSSPGNQPKQKPLPQSVGGQIRSFFRLRVRRAHAVIVTTLESVQVS